MAQNQSPDAPAEDDVRILEHRKPGGYRWDVFLGVAQRRCTARERKKPVGPLNSMQGGIRWLSGTSLRTTRTVENCCTTTEGQTARRVISADPLIGPLCDPVSET